ncbi:HNHc domain-containing protein, partial [Psidium guajava]
MAQFAAQARVKLLFNGEGWSSSSALEPKDLFFCHNLASAKLRRHGLRFLRSASARLSSHSAAAESRRLRAEFARSSAWADSFDDYDYDSDTETDDLACFRGLVLDIAYRPVDVVSWRRAICLEFMEKADVLEYYDRTVDSPSGSFYIPAVLRVPHLLQVIKRRLIRTNLNHKNIFYRDNYSCQYCSSRENLTIDHVLPIARGGEWTWQNLVTACVRCNSRKGQKTLEEANMKLITVPKAPKDYDILAIPLTMATIKMLKMRKEMPKEWLQYLAKRSSY